MDDTPHDAATRGPTRAPARRAALPLLVAAAVLAGPARGQTAGETILVRSLTNETLIRATAIAEEERTIASPVRFLQLKWLVPEGAFVRAGELVTVFDEIDARRRLRERELDRDVTEAQLAYDLTTLRNTRMALDDTLRELDDRLAVEHTRRDRLRSLPDAAEVAIAAGKLRVAELHHRAATGELRRATSRLERGLLAPAAFERFEVTAHETAARLRHAQDVLAYTRLPAADSALRRVSLTIENIELERVKVRQEREESEELSRIKAEGARASLEIALQRLRESVEDLDNIQVRAPASGYVMYLREFRNRFLRTGQKMWRNFSYLRIPNPERLAFKAQIPEATRGFIAEGDAVDLRVVERPDEPLRGRVHSISLLSRDRGEREEEPWGGSRQSGLKVYDIVVRPETTPAWLRYGMHAECRVVSSLPVRGPSVPLSWVKRHDDAFHVAVEGFYTPVAGRIVGAHFVFDDPAWAGRQVQRFGRLPVARADSAPLAPNRARALGELVPADSADVVVRDVHRWPKVAWLIPEDTFVTAGDEVARLDATETLEEIKRQQSELRRLESVRKTADQAYALQLRESAFQLARESNLVAIARIDFETARDGRDAIGFFEARLAFEEGAIQERAQSNRLARAEGQRQGALAPAEVERLRRDLARTRLRQEAAGIRLALVERGPTEEALAAAETESVERRRRLWILEQQTRTDTFRASREMLKASRAEERARLQLDRLERREANLTLTAPRAGIARYARIWNSGAFSKVNVGSAVSRRFVLLQVADVARMHVRIEVPERYFTRLAVGQAVQVSLPALTDAILPGHIDSFEYLFEAKRARDAQAGLYSSHEPLGETVFYARVELDDPSIELKPGAVAEVALPFPP